MKYSIDIKDDVLELTKEWMDKNPGFRLQDVVNLALRHFANTALAEEPEISECEFCEKEILKSMEKHKNAFEGMRCSN